MTGASYDYDHLARFVREVRLELGLAITAVAEAASMSKDTYKRVETGKPIREANYGKIDKALHLAPGSCLAVLEGAEAAEVVTPPGRGRPGALAVSLETAVRDAVASAVISSSDTLTAAQIRDLSQRILEELKDRGILE